ncbi:hypothetical protein Raf01_84820 [Rugosimonospora africana]|uniref:Uncharacterized protein n=2 Tax=Rugosimonospora africana TaxID=556532 RepID=A0A8J3QZQ4_9ACTN|nr:hypothetical protein Raf01_84820 [Rugosimonospora africana]
MRPPPYDDPPYHDPWGSTVPLSGASSAGPSPTLPLPASPASEPDPAGLPTSSRPPGARYPYPGLASTYSEVPAAYPAGEPVIVQIGDIQVTATTVRTPAGTFPLRGSQWTVTDQWTTEQKIPTWAIVLSIALFFCIAFFSLLFLLAKETTYRAVVQVHVSNGPYQYVARIPATQQNEVQYIYQQVNYVRSLATM